MKHFLVLFLCAISTVSADSFLMKIEHGTPVACDLDKTMITRAGGTSINIPVGGYTISASGKYFIGDLSPAFAAGVTPITITASNVELDLNGFTITGPAGSGTADIINVTGANNVLIKNGVVQNPERSGIRIENSRDITIQDIRAEFTSGATLATNAVAGFELVQCQDCCIDNCVARNIRSEVDAFGFTSDNGSVNTFQNCIAKGTQTSSALVTNQATGIRFTLSEVGSTIENNMVCDTTATLTSVPYGIRLEYQNPTLTFANPSIERGSSVDYVEWSPDDRFLAIVRSEILEVYEFRTDQFIFLASFPLVSGIITEVDWSPDGRYIALSQSENATPSLQVVEFNEVSLSSVTSVAFADNFDIETVSWSPNGRFIALGERNSGSVVRVYRFDGSSLVPAGAVSVGQVRSVDWSFDSQYIAVVTQSNIDLVILQHASSGGANTLTIVASFIDPDAPKFVRWSPNGRYIAVADSGGGSPEASVYEFNDNVSPNTLTLRAEAPLPGQGLSLDWSEDGRFIFETTVVQARALSFDGTSLTVIASRNLGTTINKGSLKKDGSLYVTVTNAGTPEVRSLTGLVPAQNCVVKDNIVKNTKGTDTGQAGVNAGLGIVASTADNMVINNTAFDNDQNYAFSINVFEQFVANLRASTPLPFFNFASPTP